MSDPAEILEGRVLADLDPRGRIEEAHGLWELAAVRCCLFCQQLATGHGGSLTVLKELVSDERDAFKNWQAVSREVGA